MKNYSKKKIETSILDLMTQKEGKRKEEKNKRFEISPSVKYGNLKGQREQVFSHLGSIISESNLSKGSIGMRKKSEDKKSRTLSQNSTNTSTASTMNHKKSEMKDPNPQKFLHRNDLFLKQRNTRLQNQRRKALYDIDSQCRFKPVVSHKNNRQIEEMLILRNSKDNEIKIIEKDNIGVYQDHYYKKKGYSYKKAILEKKSVQSKRKGLKQMMEQSMKYFDKKIKQNESLADPNQQIKETSKHTSKLFEVEEIDEPESYYLDQGQTGQIYLSSASSILKGSHLEEEQTIQNNTSSFFTEVSSLLAPSLLENECPQKKQNEEKKQTNWITSESSNFSKKESHLQIDMIITKQIEEAKNEDASAKNACEEIEDKLYEKQKENTVISQQVESTEDLLISEEVVCEVQIDSLAFQAIKHPEIKYEYLLEKKQIKSEKEEKQTEKKNNQSWNKKLKKIQDTCFAVIKLKKVEQYEEDSEVQEVVFDDEGNKIEKHYIEIKNFGFCRFMIVNDDSSQ